MPEAPVVDPATSAPSSPVVPPVVPDVVDTTGVTNASVAPWEYENTGWWETPDRTAPRGWWENPYVSYRGNFATGGDTADDPTLIPAQPMRYLSALQDAPRGVTELQKWYMRGYGPSGSLPESANYPPEMLAKAKAMGLAGLRPSGIIRTSVPDELRKMIEERNKIDPLPKEPSTSEGDSQSLRDKIWERQQNAGGGIGGDYGDSRGLDDAFGGIGAGVGAGVGDYGGPGDAYSGDPSYGSEYGRAKGGVVRYAEGGEAAGSITDALNPEDPLVANAVDAISGNLSQDEATLAMGALLEALTQRYGKEQANMLLRELVGIVSQGGMSGPAAEFGADTSREIPDQGRDMDGMSDMTPANIIPSESRNYAKGGNARVTEGEYIVSNADLSAAGNGDREAGVSKLESLLGSLREDHYGTRRHPNATNFEQVAGRVFS
jgi:hypothetical protein